MASSTNLPPNTTIPSFNNPNLGYKVIRHIGDGAYGTVYEVEAMTTSTSTSTKTKPKLTKATTTTTTKKQAQPPTASSHEKQLLALKLLPTKGHTSTSRHESHDLLFRTEATALLVSRSHPYILHLLDICYSPSLPYGALITPLATEGNLLTVHDSMISGKRQTDVLSRVLCWQMLSALHFLHEELKPGRVHRDIKPDNILAFLCSSDNNGVDGQSKNSYMFKLADFGISDCIDDTITPTSNTINSTSSSSSSSSSNNKAKINKREEIKGRAYAPYRAPETRTPNTKQIHTPHYEDRADIYSFGIVLFQLHLEILGSYAAVNPRQLQKDGTVPVQVKRLVGHMLQPKAEKRPSARVCLGYEWVKGGEGVKLIKEEGRGEGGEDGYGDGGEDAYGDVGVLGRTMSSLSLESDW
jgi:serine/threonine protein kinase